MTAAGKTMLLVEASGTASNLITMRGFDSSFNAKSRDAVWPNESLTRNVIWVTAVAERAWQNLPTISPLLNSNPSGSLFVKGSQM
jgi:hypothetical protein